MPFKDLETNADLWMVVPGDWRKPGELQEFRLHWDKDRDYGQILPRPEPEAIRQFYAVDYYTHHEEADTAETGLRQRVLNKLAWWADHGEVTDARFWKRVLGDSPLRVLEIGCGNGFNLTQIAALGHDVVGVEPDDKACAVASAAGHTVFMGTAERLPPEVEGQLFDVVIMMHVLEHCLNPGAALRSAHEVLTPGGTLVVEVPNNACSAIDAFQTAWFFLDVPRHLNFFTEKSLREALNFAEFIPKEVGYLGYCRQFSAPWRKSQARIAQALDQAEPAPSSYWSQLFMTMFGQKKRKYDSVRIVAEKAAH